MGSGFEIAWLEIADEPAVWRDAGFTVDEQGCCVIGTVEHRLTGSVEGVAGITRWGIVPLGVEGRGTAETGSIDGIGTTFVDDFEWAVPGAHPNAVHPNAAHPNGVFRIDHLVIRTPDTPRTAAALRSAGLGQRGHRDTNSAGEAVDMTFFWAGPVLLELAGPPTPKLGGGPARLGGLAFATDRLDELVAGLGDRVTTPRAAVQPGRRIAALTKAAGCSTPVAFMTPHRS